MNIKEFIVKKERKKLAVLVSGNGTTLQAIIDAIKDKELEVKKAVESTQDIETQGELLNEADEVIIEPTQE